eukprot:s52_g17.t1
MPQADAGAECRDRIWLQINKSECFRPGFLDFFFGGPSVHRRGATVMFCFCCTQKENEQEASFAIQRDSDSVDGLLKGALANEERFPELNHAASVQNSGFLGAMEKITFGGEAVQEISAPLAGRTVDGGKPGVVSFGPKDIPVDEDADETKEALVKDPPPPRLSRRSTGWVQ